MREYIMKPGDLVTYNNQPAMILRVYPQGKDCDVLVQILESGIEVRLWAEVVQLYPSS